MSGQIIEIEKSACCSYPIYSVALNPKPTQEQEFASSFGCKIKVWSLSNYFHNPKELVGHKDYVTCMQFSPDGYLLASGSRDNSVKIWDLILSKEIFTLNSHEKAVNKIVFNSSGNLLASCGKDGKIILWDAKSGTKIRNLLECKTSINSIAFSYDDKYLVGGQDNFIIVWDLVNFELIDTITIHSAPITEVAFLPNSYRIASGSEDNNIKICDFQLNQTIATFKGHSKAITSISFAKDSVNRNILISASRDESIKFWDIESQKEIATIQSGTDIINSIASTFDTLNPYHNVLLSGSDEDMKLKFWSTKDKKGIAELIPVKDSSYIIKTPDNYFCASPKAYPYIIFNSVTYSPDGKYFVTVSDNTAKVWETSSGLLMHILEGHIDRINSASYNPDGNKIVTASNFNVKIWDAATGNLLTDLRVDNLVISAKFSWDGKYIFTTSTETKNTWEVSSGNLLNKEHNEQFISTNTYAPSEFLEMKLNRPDIILKRLNVCDTNITGSFFKAYQKRLRKSGFDKSIFENDFNWPEILIKGEPPLTTSARNINLNITSTDEKYNLDRIVLNVNGVDKNFSIREKHLHNFSDRLNVELSNGKNAIKITAINTEGVSSESISFETTCSGEQIPENLYIVAIGVANYADSTMDLKYSAYDANKIMDFFKSQNKFQNIYPFLITDFRATRENILSMKLELLKSKIDDQIILFYSGHSLLSDNLDFYYATYDLDFKHPEIRGLLYDDLEDLALNIPARKKILFMDASFGDVDKEEYYKSTDSNAVNVIKERGYQVLNVNSKKYANSFELLNSYFPIKYTNGINVFAGASGRDYAFESDKWKGGLFTYSIINSLKEKKTDLNNDEEISLSELQTALASEVNELSRGQQKPNFRRANNNFVIYRPNEQHDSKPPEIFITEPIMANRGVEVVQIENNIIPIKGYIIDESPIKYLKIGENLIIPDSNRHFEQNLSLNEGKNDLLMVAEDIYGNQTSKIIQIMSKPKSLTEFGTYYALIIGEQDYQNNQLNLTYPLTDASNLRSVLISNYLFDSVNVFTLKNPNRQTIFKEFKKLQTKLNENDNLLVFYAGHGHRDTTMNQGFWWPSDASPDDQSNWISNSDIRDNIRALQARHVLLISDACFSGNIFFQNRDPSEVIPLAVELTIKMKSRRAITSGALETVPDKSVFMTYLLDYLKTNKEQFLYSKKLYDNIKDPITNNSSTQQRPLDGVIREAGDENGDFVFIKRKDK